MQSLLLLCSLIHGAATAPTEPSGDPLRVVATIPDLASLAREIGGDAVQVETIVKAGDNPHLILAKASQVLLVSKADVLLLMGLDYEHAFLPAILEKCRNDKVQPGGPGYMNVGERIQPLEVPTSLDRGQGADLHPKGNPHYNVDPDNGRLMARAVADVLERVDPGRKDQYEARWKAWDDRAQAKIREWDALMAPVRGSKIVTYHRSWSYLAKRYGLQVVGEVEPKPGLPPSPRHLAELTETMKSQGVKVVFIEPWYPERSLGGLIESTGAHLVKLYTTCGATPQTESYLDYMDQLLHTLAAALAPAAAAQ